MNTNRVSIPLKVKANIKKVLNEAYEEIGKDRTALKLLLTIHTNESFDQTIVRYFVNKDKAAFQKLVKYGALNIRLDGSIDASGIGIHVLNEYYGLNGSRSLRKSKAKIIV